MFTRRSLLRTATVGALSLSSLATVAEAKVKNPLPAAKVSEKRRVLMQSSSRYQNSGYLDFCDEQYERLYGSEKHEILFIPYARVSSSYDGYEK